jgi:hypothetical protein
VVAVWLVAAGASCGDAGSNQAATSSTTSTSTSAPSDPSSLDGPGSALIDGFRAPDHTRVVGIDTAGLSMSREALLLIEREPSKVARDVVEQAVALGATWWYPVYKYCAWKVPGEATTTVAQSPPTAGPLHEGPGLRCDFSFTTKTGSGFRSVSVSVQWGKGRGPTAAHLYIDTTQGGTPGPGDSVPDLSDAPKDPTPMVPSGLEVDLPTVGEVFGAENNCFLSGYSTFRVPPGAALIAPASDLAGFWDFVAFLRTDDPKAVVEDLQAQITSADGYQPDRVVTPHRVGGTTIWEAPGSDQNGGGGGCFVHSTPTGDVIVATHSD